MFLGQVLDVCGGNVYCKYGPLTSLDLFREFLLQSMFHVVGILFVDQKHRKAENVSSFHLHLADLLESCAMEATKMELQCRVLWQRSILRISYHVTMKKCQKRGGSLRNVEKC